MIKLLHVISDSNIGGAGRYLLTYLGECNTGIFDITVVVPEGSKLRQEIEKLGFRVIGCDGLAEQSFSKLGLRELKKIIKAEKPDIVHSHAVLSARIAAKLVSRKIKVVYTRHSVFPPKERLTKGIGRFANSIINSKAADGIIAVAGAAKQNLTDTGVSENKIRVIYNGVKDVPELSDEQKSEVRERLGIRSGAAVVGIVARLEAVKGHCFFIEAARIIKEKGMNAQFIIAGTGSCEEELKAQSRKAGLEDTVIFTGFLKDVTGLMNILDIQVNASFGTEAASLSLLEGMCLGKPAVVSNYGGNPELITDGENGFVVPIKSPEETALRIVNLLEDKDLYNRISDKAREVFRQRFTAREMVSQMEEYYLEITGSINSRKGRE